jgi:DNA repair protein RadA/Sms
MVRAVKNRYGPTDEVGCFDLTDEGIAELPDPSGLFLSRKTAPVPGTCVTVALEGRRPMVSEVQALVAESALAMPRRSSSGLDSSRLSMVLAVIERRVGVKLGKSDIFAATVGGVRLTEPASDLAVALAVLSAESNRAVPHTFVAVGEVGLAGEVRRVQGVQRRLAEAARLGFTHAVVPPDSGSAPDGMKVLEIADLAGAAQVLRDRFAR